MPGSRIDRSWVGLAALVQVLAGCSASPGAPIAPASPVVPNAASIAEPKAALPAKTASDRYPPAPFPTPDLGPPTGLIEPVVAWSPGSTKIAAEDFVIELGRAEKIATGCRKSTQGSLHRPVWADDDLVACDRRDGTIELENVRTGEHGELAGAAIAWSASGRYLLLDRDEGPAVFDRATKDVVDVPGGFARVEWFGSGDLLRLDGGFSTAGVLWSAAKRATVRPFDESGWWLTSTSPTGAYELELHAIYERAQAGDPEASVAYLVDTHTGARTLLAEGVSLFESTPDTLRFFSPDEKTVAVPLANVGVKLFDITRADERGDPREGGALRSPRPQSSALDVETIAERGVLAARGCETPLQIAWSAAGDLVATGSDSSHVCVFDAVSRRLVRSWEVPLRGGNPRSLPLIYLLAFCAGGKGLVAGNFDSEGYDLSVWRIPSGAEVGPISIGSRGSLDGLRLTTRGEALTENVHVDANLRIEENVGAEWRTVADITKEGRYISFAMSSPAGNGLHSEGVPLPAFENPTGATFVSISPDGEKVLGEVDGEPRVWDLTTGKQLYP